MAISTNKEYIAASLQGMNVSDTDIDLILLKSNLIGADPIDVYACDNAVYNRMSVVLKAMLQNVSESDYSVSWNIESVKMYYATLCQELGKPNVIAPKIKNRSYYW